MSSKLTILALVATALYATGVRAHESDALMFSFSGFGTLGVVHSSEDKADFTSTIYKPNGAGYSHNWSTDVDSLIGAQATANFTPQLSAILQVISEQNYDNTYRPHVEWANIRYQVTPDFTVRVGRTVLPVLLVSDSRKVSYSNPWVRPPLEVYRLVPVNSSDGIDTSYRIYADDFTHTVQANYGKGELRLPSGGGSLKGKDSWGLTYTVEYHAVTTNITYHKSSVTLDSFKPIFDGFRQFGAEGLALADKYDVDHKSFEVLAIGARYDPGKWFLMAEATQSATHSVLGREIGWYISGGYRIGKFTPYLTYSQVKADNLSDPGLNLSNLPPFLIGPATGLNAVLNSLLSTKPVQNTLSIGGRWEVMRNTDFKLQYDHTRIGASSSGVLTNHQPSFQRGSSVNLISATIDFVF